ncbi:ribose 5-phosphate isomerase A [Sphingomonas kyeonggiensis]|uniref:Ribose-5-phosphate isomerase A n=2 Tax=Sphingomonas kyeonggiensis TaxID=1268553 RepID=A0A7W6NWD3_9SPHN|nr:ribose 5-phosphate isomerase A [Sphingomonas kyeonggiensis]
MAQISAGTDEMKCAASVAAVEEVRDGMIVGLGTGSTARHAIEAIARRIAEGLRIEPVATSHATADFAASLGIPVRDFASFAAIDLAIDGVDEIDPALRAIKGAGGAMLREKIVATAATRMLAVADSSKLAEQLGNRPVPIEILPFAQAFVEHRVRDLGGEPALRRTMAETPFVTDQANFVLDAHFASIEAPGALAAALDACPGILAHGLFLTEIDALYVAGHDGVSRRERQPREPK